MYVKISTINFPQSANSVRQLTTCMIEFSRYEWKPNTMYDLIIRDEEKKTKANVD